MQIVIDNSGYSLLNLGDVAMLQVALARLTSVFPGACKKTITATPDRLRRFCPDAIPVDVLPRSVFLRTSLTPYRLANNWHRLYRFLVAQEERFRFTHGVVWNELLRWKALVRSEPLEDAKPFRELLEQADLVLATGGGYLTDAFHAHAMDVLMTLGVASGLGKPIAMLGQGIGPMRTPQLIEIARKVLPKLAALSLREGHKGLALCRTLGCRRERIAVTGDDAIELAYGIRSTSEGDALGINIRLADYAGILPRDTIAIRDGIRDFAGRVNCPIIGAPISLHEDEDCNALETLFPEWTEQFHSARQLTSPEDVIKVIGQCRLVITGSYHAGVFALAQGIPVVCLARSSYYVDKFEGLAQQFGTGCAVIRLGEADFTERFVQAVNQSWANRAEVRQALLHAAESQIKKSRAAYEGITRFCRRSGAA